LGAAASHPTPPFPGVSPDAKIARYGIQVLRDDRHYFPRYDAVVMFRRSVPQRFPQAWAALKALADEGALPATKVAEAIQKYGIDANRPAPWTV